MSRYGISFEAGIEGDAQVVEQHLDQVMGFLVESRGVTDPWIGLKPEEVEITFEIEAETGESALAEAAQLLAEAIRATGAEPPQALEAGHPDWEFQVRRAQLISA